MPFTPLHMGPGLAIKAVAGRHFSLLAFGIAQIAMDLEPLLGMIRGSEILHGLTHTYLAAAGIALLAAGITPLVARPILHRWNQELRYYRLGWFSSSETLEARPVLTGALVGTLSHIALDSFMHADIQPLLPWSKANDLLGLISISTLHHPLRQNSCRLFRTRIRGGDKGRKWQGTDRSLWTER